MKQSWKKVKLPEVVFFQEGPGLRKFQYTEEGIPFLNIRTLVNDRIDKTLCGHITEKEVNKKYKHFLLDEGDIICSTSGTIGKLAIVQKEDLPVMLNTSVIRFREMDPSIVFKKFIYYYLKSDLFLFQAKDAAKGQAQVNFGPSHLKKFDFVLPPLREQQRIVSILDEAFAAIAKAKSNAEQNLKNAKELFESNLQGIFENGNWEQKTLKEITTKIGSGATPRGGQESYKSEGTSLVRSMNVHDWEFRERNLAFIDDKQAKELNGVTLEENDVLLNITGASVARCCVFPKEYLPARVNQHVSIIRPKKEEVDAKFLNLLLTSKPYKDQLLFTGEQGATRQAITKAQIESFKIFIPSLNEQKAIVCKLDSIRDETLKLEVVYEQKIKNFEELKKSILQKAFAGEL